MPDACAGLAIAGWTFGHQTVWHERGWRGPIERTLHGQCWSRWSPAVPSSALALDPNSFRANLGLIAYYRSIGAQRESEQHLRVLDGDARQSATSYDKACLAALRGEAELALHMLHAARAARDPYIYFAGSDPDLAQLRIDARLASWLDEVDRSSRPTVSAGAGE